MAERTAEKWEGSKKHLSTRTPRGSEKFSEQPKDRFRVQIPYQSERKPFKDKMVVNRNDKLPVKTFTSLIVGVPEDELTRTRNAKECMRSAWPALRKGYHKTMDCFGAVKTDSGTASFPKAKEYQKTKFMACDLEEDQQDLYMEESSPEDQWDTAHDQIEGSLSSSATSEGGENWWESD